MAERRYSEKELAKILREAGQRQMSGVGPSGDGGFTLAEIQALAGDVGIEPEHVAAVAAKLGTGSAKRFDPWGGSPALISNFTVPGELSEEAWQDMVAEARSTVGIAGSVDVKGSVREWFAGTDYISAHLSATPRGAETRLRLTVRQMGGLSVAWAMGFAATFVVSLITGIRMHRVGEPGMLVFAAVVSVVALALLITRTIVSSWAVKNQQMSSELTQRLKAIGSESRQAASIGAAQQEQPGIANEITT